MSSYRPEELLGPLNEVEAKNAPGLLYLAGDAELLRGGRRVSIVGSRKATPWGLEAAGAIARELVARGVTVVSGLATGIDTAAHEATLIAGGRTIAVIGTPLDQVYPKENRRLQETIAGWHLLVSQFPPGHPPRPSNWPQRNRTMALLSDATIIVEAGEKSGTLHQGWEALRLGRLLFLHEHIVQDPDLSWPHEMLGYGALSITVEALPAVLEELPERTRGTPLPL